MNDQEINLVPSKLFGVPIGSIIAWPTDTPPSGYLECAGQWLGVETFSQLYSILGYLYNIENREGYFQLPDYRGEFLRGWDHGRGIDEGRKLGEHQGDAIRNIKGQFEGAVFANYHLAVSKAIGVFQMNINTGTLQEGAISGGNITPTYYFDASLVVPTSSENRPRNNSVIYCIKAFDEISETGTIQAESALSDLANKVERQGFEQLPVQKLWVSEEYQPVLNTPTIVDHNLGINPLCCKCDVLLKCISNDGGYLAGEFAMGFFIRSHSSLSNPASPILKENSIQLNTGAIGLGVYFIQKTNGNYSEPSNLSKWRYIFRVWY